MKHIKLEPVININGKPLTVNGEGKTLPGLLDILILNAPPQLVTMQDSIHAQRYFAQVKEQPVNGVLSLEDAEYEWLANEQKGFITRCASLVFGIQAKVIRDAALNLAPPPPKVEDKPAS